MSDSLVAPAGAAVVLPPADTLFRVYGRVGSFGPKERAEAIERRLGALLKAPQFAPDSLQVVDAEQDFEIVYGDQQLLSVGEAETRALGRPRPAPAGPGPASTWPGCAPTWRRPGKSRYCAALLNTRRLAQVYGQLVGVALLGEKLPAYGTGPAAAVGAEFAGQFVRPDAPFVPPLVSVFSRPPCLTVFCKTCSSTSP